MAQITLFESTREKRLASFVKKWLNKMPTLMADDARNALDGTPRPDYRFERAKWFIEQYGRDYAYRNWFYNEYAEFYDKLGLGDIRKEIEDNDEVQES